MKMLIVEDDPDISQFMRAGFETLGYAVDSASDGERGSFMARVSPYDVIILDYSLPHKDGLTVCTEIRANGSSVPIIFLSVVGDAKRKIEALSKGADDYMTKPFHFDELDARVRALLRRPRDLAHPTLTVGDLSFDTEKRIAYRKKKPINLTRKEYSLLEYLMRNPETPVSRSMIMDHVWDAGGDPFSNTVETHILNLRKKLNIGRKKDIIKNIPGRGYIIDA